MLDNAKDRNTMTTAAIVPTPDHQAVARCTMVDSQLRTNDVIDPKLVAALRNTPRERFLPLALHAAAYTDRALPMGGERALNPVLTSARLIADVRIEPGQHVLLIGAATGYAAAVLAATGARVTAVESDPAMMAIARSALADTAGVTLVEAELDEGAVESSPYDALIIDGAVETVPIALFDQMNAGARIACGLIDGAVTRLARAIAVGGAQPVRLLPFADLECVRLPGFAPPPRFSF